jgi:ABC-type branched-subunit amino acid transport system substrate-binding protein
MKRSTTTIRLAAVAAASALVLAACGGGDSEGGDDTKSSDAPAAAKGDGTFTVGSLLPATGNLSFLGPPEFAGVELAVKDINAAGGVLGKDAAYVKGDSGGNGEGDPEIAPEESSKLIKAGVDVIVGAASSGVTKTFVEDAMKEGALVYSPANTSTDFDLVAPFNKPDLYFRTAPSDILQGAVVANLLTQDGRKNVAILSTQDPYGTTLTDEITKNVENAGGKIATTQLYGATASEFDTQAQGVADAKPDAVVVIAFAETAKIIPALESVGAGPQDVPTYFVDGNTASYAADTDNPLPEGTLTGTKGTIPGAAAPEEFRKRLLEVDPELKDYSYSAESYDAVITSALAAEAAKSDAGADIAKALPDVTKGGEKCDTFEACIALVKEGKDIDYDGVSGPIELGTTGSPLAASIGIYEYKADNTYEPTEFIAGEVPDPSEG